MSGWLGYLAVSAFVAGLLGGAHCAAMCGGIVAACTSRRAPGTPERWRFALAYNAGRIGSYILAGVLAGTIGQASVFLHGGATVQRVLLIAAGVSMALLALWLAGVSGLVRRFEAAGGVVWKVLQPYSRRVLPADTPRQALALGALWGWLPCGMVYSVLLIAVSTGSAVEGALVMTAFGLGTLPNLLAIGALAARLRALSANPRLRGAVAASVGALGVAALLAGAQPDAFAPDGFLCRTVPGLAQRTR